MLNGEEGHMKTPIIEAKLQPAVSGKLFTRARLIDRLKRNSAKKLLLIDAYEGSGKTTLAFQFIETQPHESLWYNLDLYDQDPAVFFDYLIIGLRKFYPDFCKDLESHSFFSSDFWAHFIQELQKTVQSPLYIVFDNFECVHHSKGLKQFFIYFVQHLPPTTHLLFLTSQTPNFCFTRYRLTEDLLQLKASDMAFTPEEAQRLFQDLYKISVSRATVDRIVEETEGWALALVLIAQKICDQKASDGTFQANPTEGYDEDLYEYFLEEILKSRPRPVQELMLSSALLPFISPSELNALLGPKNAQSLIESVRESNTPVFPRNGGTETFRYHNLFRKFLLTKLHEQKPESDLMRLYGKAADSLKKNHPVKAIEYYLDAGDVREAVAMLEELGWNLIRQGRYETLKRLLKKMPLELRRQNPVFLCFGGRINEIQGDIEGAQNSYQKALAELDDEAQDARAACNVHLGILEYKSDRFRQAGRLFDSALDQLEGATAHEDVAKRLVATHANLAMVYCKLEEKEKTANHLERAQSLFDLYGKPKDELVLLQAKTLERMVTGAFHEVVQLGKRGKELCRSFGFEGIIPVFNHYLSFVHGYMGHFQESRILAEKGIAILKDQGAEDNILGALLADLGHSQLAEGYIAKGMGNIQESTRLFKKSHNFCGQFWNDCGMCLLATRQNDMPEAWDYYRRMERNSRQLSLPMQHATTLIVEAYLAALEQVPEKTIEKISEAKKYLRKSQQRMSVFHGLVLAMKSYIMIGREDMAEETFLNHLSPGEPSQYYYSIHYEYDWFFPFVQRVLKKNPGLDSLWAGSLPKSINGKPRETNTFKMKSVSVEMPKDALLDLHLYALGPFKIVVNGKRIPLEQCPSKKALSLLKYLFFKRHEGGVLVDEALELLWPEMNPKSTRSNLRVALSMLRKVFKNQGNGSNDFTNLIRDGDRLQLSLGKSGWSDVDEFLNQAKLADYKEKKNLLSEALKHYEKIVELYRGDFLSGDLYADWSYMEREYLRDQYITSLMRMVECHQRLDNHSEAISTLYRVLKTDKYREDAYCELMSLCASTGRKGEMLRTYDLCRRAIEEDLKLELSSSTRELFKRISNSPEENSEFDYMRLSLVR